MFLCDPIASAFCPADRRNGSRDAQLWWQSTSGLALRPILSCRSNNLNLGSFAGVDSKQPFHSVGRCRNQRVGEEHLDLIIRKFESLAPGSQPVEVVERKGIGHPDTICDGVAEQICVNLCRYYLDHFGVILHHNVDKVLLCGGRASASFGGGSILDPIEIYIAGRATEEYQGQRIPVHEIAEQACRDWLRINLPASNIEQYVTIIPRIRPGSSELVQLFANSTLAALSNDTSCGAGFAPFSDIENIVLEVERKLNSPETKRIHPAIGADVKVMGVRQARHIDLTISCALVSRHLSGIDDYVRQKDTVRELAFDAVRRFTDLSVDIVVNAADDIQGRNLFLTVTGTSAEAGDDGETGRGNRTSGLITPYRVMTVEAAAGKNPVTHVGKLYNLLANRIAESIVSEIDTITDAQCVLLSRIGRPVGDPQLADIRLAYADGSTPDTTDHHVKDVVLRALSDIDRLRDDILAERVRVY